MILDRLSELLDQWEREEIDSIDFATAVHVALPALIAVARLREEK